MDENPQPLPSAWSRLKSRFADPKVLMYIALALAFSVAACGVGWQYYLKPQRKIAFTRYQSHQLLMKLYDLQLAYHAAHGTYADGLDALLASSPDGAQLRQQLRACVDLNTLAVLGEQDRFRLEVNILDPQRTAVKIRGPLGER